MNSPARLIRIAVGLVLLATPAAMSAQTLVGDGRADDSAALQKLVDAGGSVQLPKGRYRLTKTVTVDLAKLGAAGISSDGTATLVMEGPGPALKVVGTHGGTAAPKSFKPETWAQRTPLIQGFEIIGAHPGANGIEASGTMQLTLARLTIRECRHGIHLTERNRNVVVADCHLYRNRGVGLFLDRVNQHQTNVTGCHIRYNRGGGSVAIGGEVRNLHVGTCDIEANHDENGPPSANILLDSTGGSIAEVAVTGCTIQHTHKAPGSANIRLLGAGTDPSLLRREGREHTREGHVTIVGNVFSDVQVNVEIRQSRGVTVSANTFWEGFDHDLLVEDSQNVVISGNNFDRNPRYLVNGNGLAEKNGVLLRRVNDSAFSGNVVVGVRGREAAVDVEDGARLRITDNSILDSDGHALRLTRLSRSLVSGNLLRDDRPAGGRNPAAPLLVQGGEDNRIESGPSTAR
ncbi:MAG: right-handed parallel beta-helix repeat-containing protein [Opitutales bacterium]